MFSRRVIGLLLLVAVGLAVLGTSAYRGHWLQGWAIADWPAPPAVGSCVGIPGGDETTVVPCAEPHLQEVMRSVDAADPRNGAVSRHWDAFCSGPSSAYLGLAAAVAPPSDASGVAWSLPRPQFAYGLLRAPQADRAGEVGWLACIVRPQGRVAYTGSVHSVGASPDRPAAFAACGTGTDSTPGYSGVSCVEPHGWQTLGQWWGPSGMGISADGRLVATGDAPDPSLLRDSCRRYAARILGVADPTYGGLLDVDAEEANQGALVPLPELSRAPHETGEAPDPDGSDGPGGRETVFVPNGQYDCRITPTDSALNLTDGMEHWGDRPPPLRPAPAG